MITLIILILIDQKIIRWNFDVILSDRGQFKRVFGEKTDNHLYCPEDQLNLSENIGITGVIKINHQHGHNELNIDNYPAVRELNNIINEQAKQVYELSISALLKKPSIEKPSIIRNPNISRQFSLRNLLQAQNNFENAFTHSGAILAVAIYIPKQKCVRQCESSNCDCRPLIITSSWVSLYKY